MMNFPLASVYGHQQGTFPWPPQKRHTFNPPPVQDTQGDAIVWSRGPYWTKLQTAHWGNTPSKDIVRGNFGTTRVPGMTLKPEMAGYTLNPKPNPPLVMDLDLAKYKNDLPNQTLFFQQKVTDGTTHVQFSLGHYIEQGWAVSEVIELIHRWQRLGGWADVWVLGGGPWYLRDQSWAFWQPKIQPWLDQLLAAKCVDLCTVGWQLDGWNTPSDLIDIIVGIKAIVGPEIKLGTHWINEACAWWDGQTALTHHIITRFDFMTFMRGYVWGEHGWERQSPTICHNFYWQVNVDAPINDYDRDGNPYGGGMQGTLRDVMHSVAEDQRVIPCEYDYQDEFDDPTGRPEWTGAARGRYCMSAFGSSETDPSQLPGGYGGDATDNDGRVL